MFDAHNHPKPHGETKCVLTTRMHKKQHMPHASSSKSLSPFSACLQPKAAWIRCSLYSCIVVMYVSEFCGRTSTARAGVVSVHLWASQNSLASVFFFTGKENMKGDIWLGVWWPERNYLSMSKTRYDGHFPTRRESSGSWQEALHPQRERRLLTGPRSCGRRAQEQVQRVVALMWSKGRGHEWRGAASGAYFNFDEGVQFCRTTVSSCERIAFFDSRRRSRWTIVRGPKVTWDHLGPSQRINLRSRGKVGTENWNRSPQDSTCRDS